MSKFLRSTLIGCLLLGACLDGVLASDTACVYSSQKCVDGPSTRTINGVDVTRDCWNYQLIYNCIEDDYQDNCATLASFPGCSLDGSTCDAYSAVDASVCLDYSNTYHCSDKVSGGSGYVLLDTTYTIVSDTVDTSACTDYASNPACKKSGVVCTEGPSTKVINGYPVYKDCWTWDYTYTCKEADPNAYDNCSAIAATKGCSLYKTTCAQTSSVDGSCIDTLQQYWCSDKPVDTSKVILLSTSYTVVSDVTDASACSDYSNNPNCQASSQTCVDGPGTKVINGMSVYKDCWQWEYTYVCTGTPTSDCAELDDNANCTLVSTKNDVMEDGSIDPYVLTKSYECKVSDGKTTTTTSCSASTCVAGVCPEPEAAGDQDFGTAIAGLEGARQAAVYEDGSGHLFTGNRETCTASAYFGLRACCKQKVKSGGTNSAMGNLALTIGTQTVKYFGTTYVFDPLSSWLQELGVQMYQALASATAQWATEAGYDAVADQAASAYLESVSADGLEAGASAVAEGGGSTFSVYGVTMGFASDGSIVLGFDPYSFAFSVGLMIVTSIMSCTEDESTLSLQRGQRLCTSLGSWTSGPFYNRTKREAFCCYNSRLARIINEQGRPLIGKYFEGPQSESCQGFTEAELGKIDFSKIDFSEFIADIVDQQTDEGTASTTTTTGMQDLLTNYYSTGTGVRTGGTTVPTIKP